MLTQEQAFSHSIATWEGLYQDDRADVGNIVRSDGSVVGTMRGVTPAAWAHFLNRPVSDITPEMMKAINLADAARVYIDNYYNAPGFNKLDWGPSVDLVSDIGWGSGPTRGARILQTVAGLKADGVVGPNTVLGHRAFIGHHSEAGLVKVLYNARTLWYKHIVEVKPSNAKWLKGWLNRAAWQNVATPWWARWVVIAAPQQLPAEPVSRPIAEDAVFESYLDKLTDKLTELLPDYGPSLRFLQGLFS